MSTRSILARLTWRPHGSLSSRHAYALLTSAIALRQTPVFQSTMIVAREGPQLFFYKIVAYLRSIVLGGQIPVLTRPVCTSILVLHLDKAGFTRPNECGLNFSRSSRQRRNETQNGFRSMSCMSGQVPYAFALHHRGLRSDMSYFNMKAEMACTRNQENGLTNGLPLECYVICCMELFAVDHDRRMLTVLQACGSTRHSHTPVRCE